MIFRHAYKVCRAIWRLPLAWNTLAELNTRCQAMSEQLSKLTKTQAESLTILQAIAAANPQPAEDLTAAQAQADAIKAAATGLASTLGVALPVEAPANTA
jgi:hypothetical protein